MSRYIYVKKAKTSYILEWRKYILDCALVRLYLNAFDVASYEMLHVTTWKILLAFKWKMSFKGCSGITKSVQTCNYLALDMLSTALLFLCLSAANYLLVLCYHVFLGGDVLCTLQIHMFFLSTLLTKLNPCPEYLHGHI
jgi:hypothetical protein